MTLGKRIRQARLELGLSQKQLCGDKITRNMLSLIENDAATPSMETLRYLSNRLGKPMGWFLEEAAVTSKNLGVMERARQAEPQAALEILKEYESPDSVFDWEYSLLVVLHSMTLARQALKDGKTGYCRELLEQAEQAAKHTPYDTRELKRSRLLLWYELEPERAQELEKLLPEDAEPLLRAQAALQRGEYSRCRELLSGANSEKAVFLRAESYFMENDYLCAQKEYEKLPESAHVFSRLEHCCREQGDYKQAYFYACKQRDR